MTKKKYLKKNPNNLKKAAMFQLKVSDSMISGQPAELPQKHHVKEQAEEICPGGMAEKGRGERRTVKHEKRDWGVGRKEQKWLTSWQPRKSEGEKKDEKRKERQRKAICLMEAMKRGDWKRKEEKR